MHRVGVTSPSPSQAEQAVSVVPRGRNQPPLRREILCASPGMCGAAWLMEGAMGEAIAMQELRLDHRVLFPLKLNESRKPSPLVICAKRFTAPAQKCFYVCFMHTES